MSREVSFTRQIQIQGMYCPHCEIRIEKALSALDGVEAVHADYASGSAIIKSSKPLNLSQIEDTLSSLGYSLSELHVDLSRSISLLLILLGLSVILDRLGLLNRLVPRQLGESGMSYAMLFLTGLLTSIHCAAMCGGICLSQSLPGKGRWAAVLYNAGRVLSYTLIGGVLGLIGSVLGGKGMTVSPFLQAGVKLIAGFWMLVAGVNLLGLIPALRKIRLRRSGLSFSKNMPFVIGLLNGFMPCGPLQAMQLAALGSASFLWGALSMLAFSLGTVPLMLALGTATALFGKRFTRGANVAGAVLIAVFGISMLTQGAVLTGMISTIQLWAFLLALAALGIISMLPVKKPIRLSLGMLALVLFVCGVLWKPQAPDKMSDTARTDHGIQYVSSMLEAGHYPDITVRAGLPVHWTIYAGENDINACNAEMIIPALNLSLRFQPGENILEFTPKISGMIPYSCWMGMIRGNITILE